MMPERKRVSKACETCRAKKTKCDSRRPVCGRCEGYGFQCVWGVDRRCDGLHGSSRRLQKSQHGSHANLELIRTLCSALPQDTRAAIDDIVAQLKGDTGRRDGQQQQASEAPTSAAMSIDQPHSSRYLGEGSDGRFLNRAEDTFMAGGSGILDVAEEGPENEDQEQTACLRRQLNGIWGQDALSWVSIEEYLSAYFSSIHLAYPFLPQSYVMGKFKDSLADKAAGCQLTGAWLALYYGVLGLGGLYISLAGQDGPRQPPDNQHAQYFQRSISLTNVNKLEASAVQISALLVQCFYLLATSRTDSCWITLGVAIRLAQALGLHADFVGGTRAWSYPLPVSQRAEIRRRVWYTLFVLDRLLALQVGRPPAISDAGFIVALPSNLDDAEHDWHVDAPIPEDGNPSVGDYFLQVIKLSKVVGLAAAHLNEPQNLVEATSGRLRHLDSELSDWKNGLPRHLRFDIIQVFDKSPHFKRQRNMLAMEHHHLRALIHRQYLDLPAAKRNASELLTEDQMMQARAYGQICVSEARQIARLFHGIQDQSQLIHEYPWWQLVSYVMCAASILIVAQALRQKDSESTRFGESGDDASTCLEILDALSKRSRAARRARDILVKLLSQCSTHAFRADVGGSGESGGGLHRPSPTVQDRNQPEDASAVCYAVGDDASFLWPSNRELAFMSGTRLPWYEGTFEPVLWSSQLLDSMAVPAINPPLSSICGSALGSVSGPMEHVGETLPASNDLNHSS